MNALIASCADSQLSFAAKQVQADVQLTRNVSQSQIAELQICRSCGLTREVPASRPVEEINYDCKEL
jgi:hypothetical protein